MKRKELQKRLSEKFFRHDVATTMSAIPTSAGNITMKKLRDLLEKGRFCPHEIEDIKHALHS